MKALFTLKEIAESKFGSVNKMLELEHVGMIFKQEDEAVVLINNSEDNKRKMQELIESKVKLCGGMIQHQNDKYFLTEHKGFAFIYQAD